MLHFKIKIWFVQKFCACLFKFPRSPENLHHIGVQIYVYIGNWYLKPSHWANPPVLWPKNRAVKVESSVCEPSPLWMQKRIKRQEPCERRENSSLTVIPVVGGLCGDVFWQLSGTSGIVFFFLFPALSHCVFFLSRSPFLPCCWDWTYTNGCCRLCVSPTGSEA